MSACDGRKIAFKRSWFVICHIPQKHIPYGELMLKEFSTMKEKINTRHFFRIEKDRLDELIARTSTDEMGLLDVIFAEEILNRKKHDHYHGS